MIAFNGGGEVGIDSGCDSAGGGHVGRESSEAVLLRLGELAHEGKASAVIAGLREWGRANLPTTDASAMAHRQRPSSRHSRERPADARDFTLEELGLDAATAGQVEVAMQSVYAGRCRERGAAGVTAGELVKWSAMDLTGFGIDGEAVVKVKRALRRVRLSLRGGG